VTRRPLAGLLLALVAVVVPLGACGMPDDDRPRLVAAEDAPIDLTPSTAPSSTSTPEGSEGVNVFYIDTDTGLLRQVRRPVEEVTPQTAIAALLSGVGEDDPDNLVSAIPADTQLVGARLEGTVLLVDLAPAQPGGILSVVGATQLQAFAQIVRTVTGLPGVSAVRFLVEGQPISAPTDAGASDEPVDRSDYASLAPRQG
jgi:spore germination protein GerM